MEGQKKPGSSSSSSSSFTSELFGSGESQRSSSSSAGIFASMFSQEGTLSGQQQDWGSKKGSSGMGQLEKGQPCHLSSSLYYGGQEVYSSTTNSAGPRTSYNKDKEDNDSNGNNSPGASRGNWWQGSLYY